MTEKPASGDAQTLPLRGIRVLDFSWLLPGPFCTMQLADLGADVVKIEGPQGDYAREMLPGLFAVANRNKRSLAMDLKAPGALAALDRMAERADVVVEGFRPGVADRLGIGFERLSGINPRLVYASLSGYGARGPLADRPGHDVNYLAMSGVLSIPGQWDVAPARGGLPVADLSAAMTAAFSIVASLLDARASGRGRHLDIGMLPALMSWAQVRTADHLASGEGAWPHLNPLNDVYEARDGARISLALVEPKFLRAFCGLAGCPALADSPDCTAFAETRDPEAGRRLRARLEEVVRGRDAAEWEALLDGEPIPFARVATPAEALANPQLSAAGIGEAPPEGLPRGYVPFPVPGLGTEEARPAPEPGQHSAEILRGFGLDPAEIDRLADAEAIA